MLNVYILIDWFLPAYKAGGPVQSVANLVAVEEKGIQYKIICSAKEWDGTVLEVERDQWVSYNPWTEVWYSSDGKIGHLLKEKNAVLFINGIYSWNYNLKPIFFSGIRKKIVSARGMLHPGALAQKGLKKKLYLSVWKLFGLHQKVEFHASTVEEKAFIQGIFGKDAKVHVAGNHPRMLKKGENTEKRKGELELVSIALISAMKNHLLVLKALKKCNGKINYNIWGPVKEEGYWQDCKDLMKTLPPNINVQYHGELAPADVERALHQHHVFILPSKSENFGHALYEALSAGRPIITSRHTPWQNLDETNAGKNCAIETEEELRLAIQYFTDMDGEEWKTWSAGAKQYAEEQIEQKELGKNYRMMFRGEKEEVITIYPFAKKEVAE